MRRPEFLDFVHFLETDLEQFLSASAIFITRIVRLSRSHQPVCCRKRRGEEKSRGGRYSVRRNYSLLCNSDFSPCGAIQFIHIGIYLTVGLCPPAENTTRKLSKPDRLTGTQLAGRRDFRYQ